MKHYLKKILVFFALIYFGLGLGMQTIEANEILPKFGGTVTSEFGWRTHPIYGTRRLHAGLDIGLDEGTKVPAALDGTVLVAEWISGYGYTVIIDYGNGITSLYGHLSEILVTPGQHVKKLEVVALSGNTG